MVRSKKTDHWVDRISDQSLRVVLLLMLFSQLIVGNTVDNVTFKTVFFSTMLVGWVVFGYVSIVKWNRNRDMDEEKPR